MTDAATGPSRGIQPAVIRGLDLALSAIGLIATSPILVVAAILIRADSPGSPVFAQTRVGRREEPFTCLKLRTMRRGTVSAATHETAAAALTRIGAVLRKIKVDELPQLWNVLKGDMSLVGPRPCLPQQAELIARRRERGVFDVRPGITGPGQVAGVDMSEPERLAKLDFDLPGRRSLGLDPPAGGDGDRLRLRRPHPHRRGVRWLRRGAPPGALS